MSLSTGTVPKPSPQSAVGRDKALKMVVRHRCPSIDKVLLDEEELPVYARISALSLPRLRDA